MSPEGQRQCSEDEISDCGSTHSVAGNFTYYLGSRSAAQYIADKLYKQVPTGSATSGYVMGCLPGLLLLLFSFLFVTMPVTYLPVLLREDFQIPEHITAFIISASTFTYVLSCLVSPRLDDKFDNNLVLVCSYFIFILTSILFAFVIYIPPRLHEAVIPTVAISLRAIGGFTAGIFENILTFSIIRKYPGYMGTITATFEGAISGGCLAGPLLGGVLFTWTLSFPTTTLIPMCPAVLVYLWFTYLSCVDLQANRFNSTSSSSNTEKGSHGGFMKVMGTWQMSLLFFSPLFCSIVNGVPLSITAIYVQDTFNGDAVTTGILFVLNTAGYTIGAVLSGILTDSSRLRQKNVGLWLFAVCPYFIAIGNFLIGSVTFTYITPSLYSIGTGFFIDGLAFGTCSGPMMRLLLNIWKGLYPNLEDDYTAYITSIFLVTFSLGEGIGNAVGGILYGYLTYTELFTVMGGLIFILGLVNTTFVFYIRNKRYVRNLFLPSEDKEGEYDPLLSSSSSSDTTPPEFRKSHSCSSLQRLRNSSANTSQREKPYLA